VTAELTETFDFVSNGSKEQDKSLAMMEKALDETSRNLKTPLLPSRDLRRNSYVQNGTHAVSTSVCLTLLRRPQKDNSRHIIARFYSRVPLGAVMRA
ncbi:hypothetical protein LSAT2_013597, partial [Lamellibrachia satsuma]